tara:strand:+ start:298 stop:663 length:366 start_codon:yes stop_codon:yes gene_type:complete
MKKKQLDSQENDLEILRYLENRQEVSQRELSKNIGISLGKINYILKALIDKGVVKARNFKNNKNKRAYAYYLTKEGILEKSRLTVNFFSKKSHEYDNLKVELQRLKKEIEDDKQRLSKNGD